MAFYPVRCGGCSLEEEKTVKFIVECLDCDEELPAAFTRFVGPRSRNNRQEWRDFCEIWAKVRVLRHTMLTYGLRPTEEQYREGLLGVHPYAKYVDIDRWVGAMVGAFGVNSYAEMVSCPADRARNILGVL